LLATHSRIRKEIVIWDQRNKTQFL